MSFIFKQMLCTFAPMTPNNLIYVAHILLIFLFPHSFYGYIMYIPQLTSNILSLLSHFFSHVDLIASNSRTYTGALALQLCYAVSIIFPYYLF